MITRKLGGVTASFFANLLKYDEISHFVTTRAGKETSSPFNLSFNGGDTAQIVRAHRQLLSKTLKIPFDGITTAKQVHGNRICIVDESLKGKGCRDYDSAIEAADALVTNVPGICPMILVADCVPILLYDPKKKAVGAVHAGWKSTLRLIARKTIEAFQEHFDSSAEDMVAGIGPSIGPCCFQVGPEVIVQVEEVLGKKACYVQNRSADGAGYFDLWKANQKQLVQSGLKEENVEVAGVCTCCDPSRLYFSYRHEQGKAGRFGAGILIR